MILVLSVNTRKGYSQNELDVVSGKWLEYGDAQNSLYRYLSDQACDLLEQRASKISKIQSLSDWQKRQKMISETLAELLGPFPQKTPLNAKIVSKIDKDSFKTEHIVFESLPGFYVTSSLYIPASREKNVRLPAVIYCSGHSVDGYRSDVYQHVILNLVKKGFIVFAFDPVGQGERLEYFDQKTGKSIVGGPTMEHSYPGAQAFLTGSSQSRYMIWDGIRSVDYLLTRKEVDPDRIGITGRSGGGTQAAYIAAIDDRIYAAAPENYITNYTRLLRSIGPQDAEQNIPGLIFAGLDHPDFLIVRAPKPALMITTTNDMFSIQGARETEKEVSVIYKAYDKSESFSRVEDVAGHASTLKNREAMYAFFQKNLNNPGNQLDEEVTALTKEELKVTKTGQVSTLYGSETVFSLNLKEERLLAESLSRYSEDLEVFLKSVVASAKRLSGYHEPSATDKPVFTGIIQRNNYVIEKYFIKGEGDYVIPYLLFKPDKPGANTMIYLHPSGKATEASKGGEIEKFVNRGITVLAPDLPGIGEMGPGTLRGDAYFNGASHNLWYASMLSGRSITGIQAGDVVKLARVLKKIEVSKVIIGFARKEMAPVLLHSAAFSDEIGDIILVEPYLSFRSIAGSRFYNPFYIMSTIPAALKEYDLPFLASSLAPEKLMIIGPFDGNGERADTQSISRDLEIIQKSYIKRNAENRLKILIDQTEEINYDIFFEWFK